MKNTFQIVTLVACIIAMSMTLQAAEQVGPSKAAQTQRAEYLNAAKKAYSFYQSNKSGDKGEEALIKTCRALDLSEPYVYEDADAQCGLTKKEPDCFEKYVSNLNQGFGQNAFFYWPERVQIQYSASHCQDYLSQCGTNFPQCRFRDEAELRLLRGRKLIGNNLDQIFGLVQSWLTKYPESQYRARARLLEARLHMDAWILFKRHSFVAEGMKVTPEEFLLRASKHRFESLKFFLEIMEQFPGSYEAKVAKKERDLLEKEQDDGILYGISF